MSWGKKLWAAIEIIIAIYFVCLGIYEMIDNVDIYPWFIEVCFGLVVGFQVLAARNWDQLLDIYKETINIHTDTIEIQADTIEMQAKEIIAMQQRLKQWN